MTLITLDPRVKALLRNCPNKRLHVLIALWACASPPTASDLAREIPMSREAVGIHLDGLRADGYAANVGQRWFLTDKGRQLPLPGLLLENIKSVGKSDTLALTTTTVNIESDSHKELVVVEESDGKTDTLPEGCDETVLTELHALGINGKKAIELAQREWVTVEYARAHVALARAEEQRLGLAIHRMIEGDPMPDICEGCGEINGKHSLGCASSGREYISGQYADLIQH